MRAGARWTAMVTAAMLMLPLRAVAASDGAPDEQSIAALEARASQAQPRDQCFLYAEVAHQMTELSVRHFMAGDMAQTESLLRRVQLVVAKINRTLAVNDKRLKNAEILLGKTAFRLKEMLHASDYQAQPLVAQTLAKVNHAQDAAMLTVFEK